MTGNNTLGLAIGKGTDTTGITINPETQDFSYNGENFKEGNTRYRPLHCSELQKILLNGRHGFEAFGCPVKDDNLYYYDTNKDTVVAQINWNDSDIKFPIKDEELEKTKLQDFETYYNTYIGKMETVLNFYDTSKAVVNVMDDTVILDILKLNNDTYTDSLELGCIMNYINSDLYSRIDITILYSKDSDQIYTWDSTFDGTDKNITGLISSNEDIQLEFIDGILRVYPKVDNINECVIEKCRLVYYGNK